MKNNIPMSKMVCPLCGKEFDTVREFAKHLMEHSDEEEKQKAEAEERQKDEERKKFIEKLNTLRARAKAAEDEYNAAMAEYHDKFAANRRTYTVPFDLFNLFF